ncbi:UDP-glucoronosyl and UDP-glucosyl transferase domain-containing protein [Ditylenchus destructor]|uniref:glucuronosyltransferase n=1 Tax=Ditylenchus destructor TaxID=166010 RepID=A0AAD4MPS1_9BILA|nr:UDP-glucoronosyl and UDP-glucosyl transferase domain-containing protein [Ditylenchus destructor]
MYQTALSPSHVGFSGGLADILIQAGHTVDKLIIEYNPTVLTNGSTKLRNVYRIGMTGHNPFMDLKHLTSPFENIVAPFFRRDEGYEHAKMSLCEALISNKELINRLKSENYDLYITAAYDGCTFGLYHLLNIPSMVGYTAIPLMDEIFQLLGIPVPPSFVTSTLRARPGDRDQLSFYRRVENFLEAADDAISPKHHGPEQDLFEKYYPGFPPLRSIGATMSFLFLNTDEILDIPKPISPKVKFIGGIAMKKPKELSQEFENILSIPSKGVILFSFGSLVKTTQIPFSAKVELLNAFREFPDYTILWKYDDFEADADLLRNYSNVYTRSWLPQKELLHDPRVKVFITHMGLNSYLELSHAGVPVIGIPILGDQFYNTGCAEKNGVAVQLDKTRLTTSSVVAALREVLDNPSYTLRAKEISRLLAKKPDKITPEKFVQYIEFAAEFPRIGTDVYQLASARMNLLVYLSLDVVLFLLGCATLVIGLVIVLFKTAKSLLRKKFVAKDGHKKVQ